MIKEMVMEKSLMQMEQNMRVIGEMIKNGVMENTLMQMELYIKVIGTVKNMVMEK
jgi:hypothetical protein